MSGAATSAPAGWHVRLQPLDGGPPHVLGLTVGGRSLDYCRRVLSDWRASFVNNGRTVATIEPVAGWESIEGDPVLAICYAIGAGELAPDVGAARLRALGVTERMEDL